MEALGPRGARALEPAGDAAGVVTVHGPWQAHPCRWEVQVQSVTVAVKGDVQGVVRSRGRQLAEGQDHRGYKPEDDADSFRFHLSPLSGRSEPWRGSSGATSTRIHTLAF